MDKGKKAMIPSNQIDSRYCPLPPKFPQPPNEKQPIPKGRTNITGMEVMTFREEQPFGKWRFVAMLLFIVVTLFLYMIIVIIPITPSSILLGILLTGSMFFAIIIFSMGKLVVETRPDGLYYRYRPFHRSFRNIPWNNIETHEVQTFSPLREWGGLGLRVKRGGRAYLASGNQGVLLHLSNGRQVMIGSKRPEELAKAIADGITGSNTQHD